MSDRQSSGQPVASIAPLTSGLRQYLYITSAICGAAILVVEILGAKMLAPYFGTSHFVWTSQIAVTLISLSVGYYIGGWMVDRKADLRRLYTCIFIAAVYLCLTVPLARPVAEACLHLKLAVGSLLASTFLFLVPLGLLAMVGPFLVRVMTLSLSVVGKQVGRLSAISTIGSVLGTVSIGYVLIPFLPNSVTMLCTAGVLAALCIVYFLFWGRQQRTITGLLLAVGGVASFMLLFPDRPQHGSMVEVARANSNFGLLQVMKLQGRPYYLFVNDLLSQNAYDTDRRQSVHVFTYMLHELSRCYTPEISDALCIGMGIGIVPMQMAREGVKVDVVEINPSVVPFAEEYFDFDSTKVNLAIDDGRHYVNEAGKQYDTILLDAFVGDSSPSHLMTREAFSAMREAMKPNGTLIINSFGDLRPGEAYYTASLHKTLAAVFKSVRVHAGKDDGNIFFVASDNPDLKMLRDPDLASVHPEVLDRVSLALRRVVQVDANEGRVLTDDFNPVEFYDAKNREQLRRSLVAWAQQ